jgi:hypothetical protein
MAAGVTWREVARRGWQPAFLRSKSSGCKGSFNREHLTDFVCSTPRSERRSEGSIANNRGAQHREPKPITDGLFDFGRAGWGPPKMYASEPNRLILSKRAEAPFESTKCRVMSRLGSGTDDYAPERTRRTACRSEISLDHEARTVAAARSAKAESP